MIRHVFRLVWNRRKENGLVVTELFVSFLILCALFTAGAGYLLSWMEPLGFDYHDVWSASIALGPYHQYDEERQTEVRRQLDELERAVNDHPDVVAASLTDNLPYDGSRRITSRWIDGENHRIRHTYIRPELFDVLRYELVEGRWYEPGDEAQRENLLVITDRLAHAYFGNEPAAGQILPSYERDGTLEEVEEEDRIRVLGVVKESKVQGEHQPAPHQFFALYDPNSGQSPPRSMLLRVQPGSGGAVEADLAALAARIAPDVDFKLYRMSSTRASFLRAALTPLVGMGIVAGFLVVMVGLGLIGVLWQNVARRRNEIGLRRALGATSGGTQRQILGELLALAALAVAAGLAVFLQLPLLGVFEASWEAVTMAVGSALAVLFGFVLICGLYPSWLASRVQPAVALMYE